jgi:uncharacterized protein involved in exopolysaccharide biosynthesis
VSQPEPLAPVGWQAPCIDFLLMLAKRQHLLAAALGLGLLGGTVAYLSTPRSYRSSAVAVLLPREKPVIGTQVTTGSLETSEDRAGRERSAALMLPPDPALYTALLTARPVLTNLSERFARRLPGHNRSEEDVEALRRMIDFESTEEGLFTILVESTDPALAADLANALLEEAVRASEAIERQMVLQQAGHLDLALESAEGRLSATQSALQDFCARYRLVDPTLEASRTTQRVNDLNAERDEALRTLVRRELSYTEVDPEVQRLRAVVTLTDRRIGELREHMAGTVADRDYGRLVVEHQGLIQRMKSARDMVATLALQAEVFRVRASQPTGSMALVRPAVAPAKPFGPSKKRFAIVALGLALVAGVTLTLLLEQWGQVRHDPYIRHRVHAIHALVPRRAGQVVGYLSGQTSQDPTP